MNHQMIIPDKEQCEPILHFTKYLEKAIRLVAIIRILIDPFPIILRDNDIQAKVFCMTKPYSDDIIDRLNYDLYLVVNILFTIFYCNPIFYLIVIFS